MNIFRKFFRKQTRDTPKLHDEFIKELCDAEENFDATGSLDYALKAITADMTQDGCDADEIPGGYGEFGLSVTNPVPVRGIPANNIYLGRLRTPDNMAITWNRIGSCWAPNGTNPIDGYRIFSADGTPLCIIYISPYHRKISAKAPRGFIMVKTDTERTL